jgi:ABC-type transport system involved in cytochrome c biogenesis permease subunit
MTIKFTMLGLLIYVALALFLAAAVVLFFRDRRRGIALYATGFIVAVAAFMARWAESGEVPLRYMFDVFLCLGVLMFPLSLACRRWLGVGDEWLDALLAAIMYVPAGFVFVAEARPLPPLLQSIIFIPHVSAYMISYVIMAKAVVPAVRACLVQPPPGAGSGLVAWDLGAYRMVSLGFPLLTLGLVLGAVWGQRAWGDYWNWDPKELWSLASWLVYVGYFHVRYMFGPRRSRLAAALVILGIIAIVITLLVVNLSNVFGGMHSYAA